jgi:hypothetical protein
MSPTKIMLIRHAEKPVPDGAPGVAPDGSPDSKSLSQIGWARATKLVGFFSQPTARHIDKPDAIIAASPDIGSRRPAETVTPLVNALWEDPERAQRFNQSIPKEDVTKLAAAVMAADGVVLVAWEHTLIHDAVTALPNAPETPAKWPGDRFDVVWILKPKPGGWDFQQTPQMLMPTDQDSLLPFSHHHSG